VNVIRTEANFNEVGLVLGNVVENEIDILTLNEVNFKSVRKESQTVDIQFKKTNHDSRYARESLEHWNLCHVHKRRNRENCNE
jgi:hypothetical protein